MAEPLIITTLTGKIASIERYIAGMEARIGDARRDIAHLRATLHLFNRDEPGTPLPHMGLRRVFRRGEITKACLVALHEAPDGLDTRELALAVMASKGSPACGIR